MIVHRSCPPPRLDEARDPRVRVDFASSNDSKLNVLGGPMLHSRGTSYTPARHRRYATSRHFSLQKDTCHSKKYHTRFHTVILEMFGDDPREAIPSASLLLFEDGLILKTRANFSTNLDAEFPLDIFPACFLLARFFEGGPAMGSVGFILLFLALPERVKNLERETSPAPSRTRLRFRAAGIQRTRTPRARVARIPRHPLAHIVLAALLGAASSCKPDDEPLPTTPLSLQGNAAIAVAANISAPRPLSPADGTQINDTQPTLTVENATVTDDIVVTYRFEVATDADFQSFVANGDDIPQTKEQTSWRVSPPLGDDRYFWRARAENQRNVAGPYSSPVAFTVTNAGIVVFDSLMDGTSAGDVGGGEFVAQGWRVTTRSDFIRYAVRTIASGFVEWENLGLQPYNPQSDLYTLFGMWDPSRGDYRENPYRVHVRKLDTQGHNPPYLRMRFISGGDQHDVGYDFLQWNPGQTYRFRVEWGPSGGGNEARVLLDGRVVIRTVYGPAYRPRDHWIEMGVEERAESIVGIIYKNVRIGRR